ncbi:hypothetical protein N7493_008800 [Penicillium malachiteum]|uniref:Autophagy-related protein 29 n=1 Tax=Penicillium malachiteum TaxID=1324776 RepID=A0AAD6HFG0_9EURO|nr:hypothetical protein N7493_008800 [Penicillium malachiteum]
MATKADPGDTNFTVFIRLPFPRHHFIDPPPVEWNAAKDQALWDILSRPSRGDGIDWKALADSFDVTLQFLLQQAAWLYDRQFSHVRAQMRKYDPTAQSNSPSPAPGSISGSVALMGPAAKGSGTNGLRPPPRQSSQQKEIPQRVSGHGRRTSTASTTTINQFRVSEDPSRTGTPTAEGERQRDSISHRPQTNKREQAPIAPFMRSPPLEEEDILSSSSDSDSEEDLQPAAHRFRRFGQFSMHRASLREDENDEEDDTPAFLPTSHDPERAARDRASPVMGSTLRVNADRAPVARRRLPDRTVTTVPVGYESSTSSMSSGVPVAVHRDGEIRRSGHGSGTLGPQRVGEPPRLSPHKSNASGREASDGTPSMGSSFSDLDDTSVTQSAMEEALISNMQHGGMASRMSTISQALRSRYLQ